MNQLQTVAMGFKEKWAQLSFSQKMMFGTILIGMILASVFLVQRTQDDYDVLYSNLSLPDASAMVAKLKEMKTPFKLADGGTTILVPRGSHDTLILETAGELNSENTISLSKIPPVAQGDVQREWIRKLNTDSIAQILMSIRGIKSAHVIVSQPDKSVFSDSEDPVTASVMLMVEPGFRLNEEQVKTIKNLVSHSVPGLTNDHVAIADNQGNSLEGNPMASNMGANGESEVDMRRKEFEKETSKKVLAILSPIVGKDNAVVSVSAVLNFDKAQSKIHRVIPAGGDEANPTGVAVSTQEQTEEYSGSGPKPEGGPAGVETNVTPGYVGE
jgi:flagellar M-ring protein FliF